MVEKQDQEKPEKDVFNIQNYDEMKDNRQHITWDYKMKDDNPKGVI